MISQRRINDASKMLENNGFTVAPEAMHLYLATFLIVCTATPSKNFF